MVAPAPRLTHDCRLCLVRDALSAAYDKQYAAYKVTNSDLFKGSCYGLELAVSAIDKALDCQIAPLHVERDELDRGENKRNSLPVWLQWAIGAIGVAVWWVAK